MLLQGIIAGNAAGAAEHERKMAQLEAMGVAGRHSNEVNALKNDIAEWQARYFDAEFGAANDHAVKIALLDEQKAFMERVRLLPRTITPEVLLETMPVSQSRERRIEIGMRAARAEMEDLISRASSDLLKARIRDAFAKWEAKQ